VFTKTISNVSLPVGLTVDIDDLLENCLIKSIEHSTSKYAVC